MIVLKTGRELKIMKEACSISAGALEAAGKAVEPGVTTAEIDRLAEEYIRRRGGEPDSRRPPNAAPHRAAVRPTCR